MGGYDGLWSALKHIPALERVADRVMELWKTFDRKAEPEELNLPAMEKNHLELLLKAFALGPAVSRAFWIHRGLSSFEDINIGYSRETAIYILIDSILDIQLNKKELQALRKAYTEICLDQGIKNVSLCEAINTSSGHIGLALSKLLVMVLDYSTDRRSRNDHSSKKKLLKELRHRLFDGHPWHLPGEIEESLMPTLLLCNITDIATLQRVAPFTGKLETRIPRILRQPEVQWPLKERY